MKKGVIFFFGLLALFFLFVLNFANAQNRTPAFSFSPVGGGGKVLFENIGPGDTIRGRMEVKLLDNVPTLLGIGFNDASARTASYVDGENTGVETLTLKNWLRMPDGSELLMESPGVYTVPYEIHVPEGAPPGDYGATFIAAIVEYGDYLLTEGPGSRKNSSSVKVSIGMGVEFLIRVAGEIIPELSFENLTHSVQPDGSLNLYIEYANNGNVSVLPKANILISDALGQRLYSGDFGFSVVHPEQKAKSIAHISNEEFNFVYGVYTVEVELLYDVYNFSKTAVPAVYVSGLGLLKLYSIPWVVLAVIAGIILIILFWFIYKNLRYMYLFKSSKEYLVKEKDTLQSVSEKFKVNPKKIIFVNKLKEPYFLEAGKMILIPQSKKAKN